MSLLDAAVKAGKLIKWRHLIATRTGVPVRHFLDLAGSTKRFLEELGFIAELLDRGAGFFLSEGRLHCAIGGVEFAVLAWSDLVVLCEIFCRHVYDVALERPSTVFDVGMNSGAAALFFAREPLVVRVHGFEPFAPIFERAVANVARNPHLAAKVTLHPVGLGARDERLEVDFGVDGNQGANATLNAVPELRRLVGASSYRREFVTLRNAGSELAPLLDDAKDTQAVLKLDAEGAEYDILPALHGSGLLARFNVIFVEHHHAAAPLIDLLHRDGFTVFRQGPARPGLLRAAR